MVQSALAALGVPAAQAAALARHAATSGMPSSGALARIAQLAFGVSHDIISRSEAEALVCGQPEYLRCDFRTVFEDDAIVAIDKPWDVRLEYDDGERWEGEPTVRDYLSRSHEAVLTDEGEVRLCHRLDFATSGVLVAAKSHAAAGDVARCFRERSARKLYAALVLGHPSWEEEEWSARIYPSRRRFRQKVSPAGKAARTEASVCARGTLRLEGERLGAPASLLWLRPHTGRRHQLRVHAAHYGFPIVGDFTYATDRLQYRTFLHAAALELPRQGGPGPKGAAARAAAAADATVVRVEAPLEPAGWEHAFEASEEPRDPPGWEGAARRLLRP